MTAQKNWLAIACLALIFVGCDDDGGDDGAGGAMSAGGAMAGGAMAGGAMAGGEMAGGSMSGGEMAGGAMPGGASMPDCVEDEDCAAGEVCADGTCGPPPPECQADGDCGEGEVCADGQCVIPEPECVADQDCGAGRVCVDGACEAAPMPCGDMGPCDADEICVQGRCEPRVDPECREDADCGGGEICDGGQCVPAPPMGAGTCAEPIAVGVGQVVIGSTADAANEQSGSCGGGDANDVVYVFEAAADGVVCVSLGGSAFDTVLHVRGGDCAAESELACNDDSRDIAGGLQSALEVMVTAGTSYYVVVDAYGDNSGDYRLSTGNGGCADNPVPQCDDDGDCGEGGVCDGGACLLPCDEANPCAGDNVCVDGACIQPQCREDDDCFGDFRCVDFNCVQCVGNDECPDGVCDAGACVQCIADGDCDGGRCDRGNCVGCLEDGDCAAGEVCARGQCVGMGNAGACDAPTAYEIGAVVRGSTVGVGADHGASCGFNAASPEAVFVFSVDADQAVCLSTAGSAYDTVLHVRGGDCADADAEVGCNDDDGGVAPRPQSALSLDAVADTQYYVFVDGFGGGSAGEFVLSSRAGACDADNPPPACDDDGDCGEGFVCDGGACVMGGGPVARGPAAGETVVSEIMYDPHNGLLDDNAEWVELHNNTDDALSLDGCYLFDGAAADNPVEQGMDLTGTVMNPGAYVVFARSDDPGLNGGLRIAGTFDFALGNGGDTVGVWCDGVVVDTVTYDVSDAFPDARAATLNRNVLQLDGLNDENTRWCLGTEPYLDDPAHLGTPGAANVVCEDPVEGCRNDDECDGDAVCVDGECIRVPPPQCRADADCADGQTCRDGVCVEAPAVPGTCDDPLPLAIGDVVRGSTEGRENGAGAGCGGGARSPDITYTFEATA